MPHSCYGPSVISVTVTKRGQPGDGGLYRTSGTMGRGVAESRGQFSTWERDVPTYRRTQSLLWRGVMYLSTRSLLLDSSLCSNS